MNIKQLQEVLKNNKQITWDKDYQIEKWCDGQAPLTILSIYKWGDVYLVSYRCSDKNCPRCNLYICPICKINNCKHTHITQHHIKIIKENGLDRFGRCEEIKKNKKTENILIDQVVFGEVNG